MLSFVYIFPSFIINLLVLMYLGSYSIKFSLIIIKSIVSKKKLELSKLMHKYLIVLILTLIINLLTSLFEVFITPILLKGVATFLF